MEEEELARLTCHVKAAAERLVEKGKPSPTVFEIETAIAFCISRKAGVILLYWSPVWAD